MYLFNSCSVSADDGADVLLLQEDNLPEVSFGNMVDPCRQRHHHPLYITGSYGHLHFVGVHICMEG